MRLFFLFFGAFLALSAVSVRAEEPKMSCKPAEEARADIHTIANRFNAVVLNMDASQTGRFLAFINALPPETDIKADTVTLIVAQDLRALVFFNRGDQVCGAMPLPPAATQAVIKAAVGDKA